MALTAALARAHATIPTISSLCILGPSLPGALYEQLEPVSHCSYSLNSPFSSSSVTVYALSRSYLFKQLPASPTSHKPNNSLIVVLLQPPKPRQHLASCDQFSSIRTFFSFTPFTHDIEKVSADIPSGIMAAAEQVTVAVTRLQTAADSNGFFHWSEITPKQRKAFANVNGVLQHP